MRRAITNAYTDSEGNSNTEASSHTAAETVVQCGLGSAIVLLAPSGILPDGPLAGCAFDDGTMSYELFEHFASEAEL